MSSNNENSTSIAGVLESLHDAEESFFHAKNYLIVQATICAPVREITLAILQPLHHTAVDFLRPVVRAWNDFSLLVGYFSHPSRAISPSATSMLDNVAQYHSMRLNVQIARDTFPLLEATIINTEATLVAEIGRTIHRDWLFQWLTWSASMRLALLHDLPHLISALRHHCQETMRCLNIIEGFIRCLDFFFSDSERAGAFRKHTEAVEGLCNLAEIAIQSRDGTYSHTIEPGAWQQYYMGQNYLRRDSMSSYLTGLTICSYTWFLLRLLFWR